MSGIERRLTKLEATSGHTERLVIFVSFVPGPDLHATATVDGRMWHRERDELEEAFLARVAAEAGPARPGCGAAVAFLDYMVPPEPESRSEAAEASGRPFPPSFVTLVGA